MALNDMQTISFRFILKNFLIDVYYFRLQKDKFILAKKKKKRKFNHLNAKGVF